MNWDNTEKRQFKRGEVLCKIYIFFPEEKVLSSYVENISDGGVKVFLEERVADSEKVRLEIYLEDDPIICNAHVVWVNEQKDNENHLFYGVGFEFDNPQEIL